MCTMFMCNMMRCIDDEEVVTRIHDAGPFGTTPVE